MSKAKDFIKDVTSTTNEVKLAGLGKLPPETHLFELVGLIVKNVKDIDMKTLNYINGGGGIEMSFTDKFDKQKYNMVITPNRGK